MAVRVLDLKIGPRKNGVAGQYAHSVTYTLDIHGEYMESTSATFIGSTYGGPVFIDGHKIDRVVTEECGHILSPDFIRRFYGQEVVR